MIGFEVHINGSLACVAGLPVGLVGVCIMSDHRVDRFDAALPHRISVSGSWFADTWSRCYEWLQRPLQIGDELVIRVVDLAQPDPPATSRQSHPLAAAIGCLRGAASAVPELDPTEKLAKELLEIVQVWEEAVRRGIPIAYEAGLRRRE